MTTTPIEQQLAERDAQLCAMREALIWCSGSADFGPGGKAEIGWNKLCRPLITALANLRTKEEE